MAVNIVDFHADGFPFIGNGEVARLGNVKEKLYFCKNERLQFYYCSNNNISLFTHKTPMKKIVLLIILAFCITACHKKQQEQEEIAQEPNYTFMKHLDESTVELYHILINGYPEEDNSLDNVLKWANITKQEFARYEATKGSHNQSYDYHSFLNKLQTISDSIDSLHVSGTSELADVYEAKLYITECYNATLNNMILSIDSTFFQEMDAWWQFNKDWEQYVDMWAGAEVWCGSMAAWYGLSAIVYSRKIRIDDQIRILSTTKGVNLYKKSKDKVTTTSIAKADSEFHQSVVGIYQTAKNWSTSDKCTEEEMCCKKCFIEMLEEADRLKDLLLISYEKWYRVRTTLNLDYNRLNELTQGQFTKSLYEQQTARFINELAEELKNDDNYWWVEE